MAMPPQIHEKVEDAPLHTYPPQWSVQALAEAQVLSVPSNYIQDFRGKVFPVAGDGDDDVPVIDFKRIQEGDPHELATFFKANNEWGFFQLVNHQLTPGVLNRALELCRNFFQLPFSEKMQYCGADPNKGLLGYGRTVPLSETAKADWSDSLIMNGNDLVSTKEEVDLTNWKQLPEAYREGISRFARETHNLGLKLLSLLTHNLGISSVEESSCYGDVGLLLSANVYPPCPQPELVMALRAHADPSLMTLLVQDKPGLQVLKGGRSWVTIHPIDDAIVVNLGDQLEIFTNGKYKSAVHRVMANDQYTRYSLVSFLEPMADAVISPHPKLVDKEHPARYKPCRYGNYYLTNLDTISSRNDESILSTGELKSSLKLRQ